MLGTFAFTAPRRICPAYEMLAMLAANIYDLSPFHSGLGPRPDTRFYLGPYSFAPHNGILIHCTVPHTVLCRTATPHTCRRFCLWWQHNSGVGQHRP